MRPNPRGAAGERYAARELERLGYRILARNFSCRFGEVDLIAANTVTIAFVEVKTRSAGAMVPGVFAVTKAKQRRIIATALWYLASHETALQPRFDVFLAETDSGGRIVSHDYLEGAFDSEAYDAKHY